VRVTGDLASPERPERVQTPLASGAALADATNGDVRKFKRFVARATKHRGDPPARPASE
jgi:hypothetical protein